MGRGRAPCCDKIKVKKGPWTPGEDFKLVSFIKNHGHPNWRSLPQQAGLLRCGKSCRLRWINYLRPEVKRGNWTPEEEEKIIRLHQKLGNKWSKIAYEFPGRTDNEIKNVWNTHLKKRLLGHVEKNNGIAATDMDGGNNGKDFQMNKTLGFSHSPASSSSATSIFSCISDGDMSRRNQDYSKKHIAMAARSHHNLATDLYLRGEQNYTNTDLALYDDIIQERSIQDAHVSTLDSCIRNIAEITTDNSLLTICPSPPAWAAIDDSISNELTETLTQIDSSNQNQNDTPANSSHTNIFWSTVLNTITSNGVCNPDDGDNIQLLQHSQLIEDSQSPTCNHRCEVGDEVRYEEWLRYVEHELGLVENYEAASKQSPTPPNDASHCVNSH